MVGVEVGVPIKCLDEAPMTTCLPRAVVLTSPDLIDRCLDGKARGLATARTVIAFPTIKRAS